MHHTQKLLFFVVINAIAILLISFSNDRSGYTQLIPPQPTIALNQIGYQPAWPKSAFLLNASNIVGKQAELVNASTNEVVLPLQPSQPIKDKSTGDLIQVIDFSEFSQEGEYYLQFERIKSFPFKIGSNIYRDTLNTLLRSYYLQRCGIAIEDKVTGISHPPCHIKDGILAHSDRFGKKGTQISAAGGWHDAGDYGKYVTTTAVTIGRLLSLYEEYPQLLGEDLQIPESGNGMPDLLDEMQFALDWLVKMQRQDGAVYRKLSGTQWPVGFSPDEDVQQRYVYGITTPETAKFAATMAIAARVYQPLQPEKASTYLKAANLAWEFLERQTKMQVDWVEGDDAGSGKYLSSEIDREASLKTDLDDRLWATSELFITTGKPKLAEYFAQKLDLFEYSLFEWKDPSPLAMSNYLFQEKQIISKELKDQIKSKIISRANKLLKQVDKNGYRVANDRFIWGSNKMTAEEGITLAYAYKLTKKTEYLKAALDQLDYILGRNHFNQTFITAVGTNPVRHINHLWTRAKKIDIPGLLVGGPNNDAQDNIAPKNKGILSYLDDERSYATNEYAIDYNASLVALIVMLHSVE